MKTHGKKYREVKKLVEKPSYELAEGVSLLKKTSPTKFDAACEVHMQLGLDPKQADQLLRGTVVLPHGTGKSVRVIAFVPEVHEAAAKSAGAIEAGADMLVEKIMKGWLEFDVAVATPDMMKSLGKIAKTLGQKGLMPNPKAGTVTTDVSKTIGEIMKGKVEFRMDKLANVHNVFGKISFGEPQLEENLKSFLRAILSAKPSGAKGIFVKSITLASSMGPGIRLDVNKVLAGVG
ncbi:50S ribosomal protein L1, partial [Candidatus Peregrinibacteria bacterium]|nr:50S ribosomal protein L1 [Candidatus Peregrinibacteria bacterium]